MDECIRKWHKENYKRNRDVLLEKSKKYYKENKEDRFLYMKKWYEKNRERCNGYAREWQKTEKGRANQQRARTKRRNRERNIVNTLTAQEWLDILEAYNYRCAYCGCKFEIENVPTKDHIIPISKGGDNTKENIVPACKSCNSKKYDKIF